jgi:hypothetical protein
MTINFDFECPDWLAEDAEWLPASAFPLERQSRSLGSLEELFAGLNALSGMVWVLAAICPLTRTQIDAFSPSAALAESVVSGGFQDLALGGNGEGVLVSELEAVRTATPPTVSRIVRAAHNRPHLIFALAWRREGDATVG